MIYHDKRHVLSWNVTKSVTLDKKYWNSLTLQKEIVFPDFPWWWEPCHRAICPGGLKIYTVCVTSVGKCWRWSVYFTACIQCRPVFYLETLHPGILYGYLAIWTGLGGTGNLLNSHTWSHGCSLNGGSTVNKSDEKLKAMLCIGLILSN